MNRIINISIFLSLLFVVNFQSARSFAEMKGLEPYGAYGSNIRKLADNGWKTNWKDIGFSKDNIQKLCRTFGAEAITEYGKVVYGDIFHEINNEEQINDLKRLHDFVVKHMIWYGQSYKLIKLPECMAVLESVYNYDQKWLAPKRNKGYADLKKWQEEKLQILQQIIPEDKANKYRNSIIKDVIFNIPRKNLWFGTHRKDGITDGASILFAGINATDKYDENSRYGRQDVKVFIDTAGTYKRPCIGFDDRDYCISNNHIDGFVRDILHCKSHDLGPWEVKNDFVFQYGIRWRRECRFHQDQWGVVALPKYKSKMNMMGIKDYDSGGVYYEGPPEFPDYWLRCSSHFNSWSTEDRGRCKSGFWLRDKNGEILSEKLYVKYDFPIQMKLDHRIIRKSVIKRVHSFVQLARKTEQNNKTKNSKR